MQSNCTHFHFPPQVGSVRALGQFPRPGVRTPPHGVESRDDAGRRRSPVINSTARDQHSDSNVDRTTSSEHEGLHHTEGLQQSRLIRITI